MKNCLLVLFIFLLLVAVFPTSALGQGTSPVTGANETCAGPVYGRKDVLRPAEFKVPVLGMTKEALARGQKVQVILSAVLCRTGQVTDIEVSKGAPDGMTDTVVEAIRLLKFKPAENNGETVSQLAKFDFRFGFIGERHPLAQGPLEGRTIDLIEVGGYREELKSEIDECLKLISGNLYNKEQIERVWRKLIELGDFDREASTLRIEEREMSGGLGLVFELKPKTKH
jgi:TonB family protein